MPGIKMRLAILFGMLTLSACRPPLSQPIVNEFPKFTPTDTPAITYYSTPFISTPTVHNPDLDQTPTMKDADLKRRVYLDSTELVVSESFPPQISVLIKGSLPTPCHHLQIDYSEPDSQNRIHVEVYSLLPGRKICTQVLVPFERAVKIENLSEGDYVVLVNGKDIGSFHYP